MGNLILGIAIGFIVAHLFRIPELEKWLRKKFGIKEKPEEKKKEEKPRKPV